MERYHFRMKSSENFDNFCASPRQLFLKIASALDLPIRFFYRRLAVNHVDIWRASRWTRSLFLQSPTSSSTLRLIWSPALKKVRMWTLALSWKFIWRLKIFPQGNVSLHNAPANFHIWVWLFKVNDIQHLNGCHLFRWKSAFRFAKPALYL